MRPFLSHLLTLFPRPYFAPMQVNCGYHVLVPEHMCEHARAVTTFGFWALNCPCCGHPWKNHNGKNCMNVSERVRTCPTVSHVLTTWGSSSDSSRLAASYGREICHTQRLAHPFGSIFQAHYGYLSVVLSCRFFQW